MNREERRKLSQGNKKVAADLKYLNTPVTLSEAVQIARGAAEDVVADYSQRAKPLQVSMSLQIEILKDIIIKSGIISEKEYQEKYIEQVTAFNEMQRKALEGADSEKSDTPNVSAKVSDIEIQKV